VSNLSNKNIQYTLDYLCADYLVCRLSMHHHKLLMTNDESGE
jgi:hypothetical protein